MRQFTMNIDDSLLRAAKAYAVKHDRNVSEIIRDLLAREVGWRALPPKEVADIGDERSKSVLLSYSAGNIDRREAMARLGLGPEDYSLFADFMWKLSVPWPQADRGQIDREAEIVADAIARADDHED